MAHEYSLVAFLRCSRDCVDDTHDKDSCPVQGHIGCKITHSPGYMVVNLGSFRLSSAQASEVKGSPPKTEVFSKFDVEMVSPIKITKRNSSKQTSSVYIPVEISDYGQVGVKYTIMELGAVCGKFYPTEKEKLRLEISRRLPKNPAIDLIRFKPFRVKVSELRLVDLQETKSASIVEKLVTFPTIWRLELADTEPGFLVEKKMPATPTQEGTPTIQRTVCCKPRVRCWLGLVMVFTLIGLVTILAFVVYQYLIADD